MLFRSERKQEEIKERGGEEEKRGWNYQSGGIDAITVSGRRGPARVAAFAGEGAGGEKALVVAPLGRRK